MRRRFLTSRSATRAVFVVIIVFVAAQMAWWIYFQARYVSDVSANIVAGLEREARALDLLLAQGATAEVEGLLADQPRLRLTADGAAVEVDEEALAELLAGQRSVVRMLAFEGPFFVLVVMTGLFIIARNLRLERELKRRQRNFLDAIGHEYKTPISTLRLLIQTVQLRALSGEKLQEYLRNMSTQLDRLEHTGQQVLATARLEAGAPNQSPEPNDLTTLVRTVLERSSATLAARGAELELQAPAEPICVQAGLDDISTILENLVDNAVKYTPGPTKWVGVRVSGSGPWACLSVEDRGSGIPAAERDNVFERFYRVGNEMTRTASGLGLGLYLVRRTAEGLGGQVRLEQGAGGGTLVTVQLPLRPADATATLDAGARKDASVPA